jgi:hypothetical protein
MTEGEVCETYFKAVWLVVRDQRPSPSYIQRRLQVGFNEAASFIERMHHEGIVSAPDEQGKRHLSAPPKEAEPWRPIEEHDNSNTEVLVMVPGYKTPITAWRHHPSSRTDIWFSLPGKYQVRPTHFRPLPSPPDQKKGE